MTDRINLTELRKWIEAAKPTGELNDNEQPIYRDDALLAEDRLWTELLNGGALALIDTAEAANRLAAEDLRDTVIGHCLACAQGDVVEEVHAADCPLIRLRETLDRYDHGDTAAL